jgi:hypothetical protein
MTSIATWKTYHRPESAVHPAGWHLDRSWTRRNCPCLANRDANFASTRQWFVQSFTSQVDLGCTSSCCCELAGQVMQSDVPPALGLTRRCTSACKSQALPAAHCLLRPNQIHKASSLKHFDTAFNGAAKPSSSACTTSHTGRVTERDALICLKP